MTVHPTITAARSVGPRDFCEVHGIKVFGVGPREVVTTIGGWLCDLAMTGRPVTAIMADDSDERPLRILGVRVSRSHVSLRSALEATRDEPIGTLAISTELLSHSPEPVQHYESCLTAVPPSYLWGRPVDAAHIRGFQPIGYRPTAAALAFKAEAMAAAEGCPCPSSGDIEILLRRNGSGPVE